MISRHQSSSNRQRAEKSSSISSVASSWICGGQATAERKGERGTVVGIRGGDGDGQQRSMTLHAVWAEMGHSACYFVACKSGSLLDLNGTVQIYRLHSAVSFADVRRSHSGGGREGACRRRIRCDWGFFFCCRFFSRKNIKDLAAAHYFLISTHQTTLELYQLSNA